MSAEEPEGVTMRPDGREVYVTCEGTNEVFAIDTATAKVAGADEDRCEAAVGRLHGRRRDRRS